MGVDPPAVSADNPFSNKDMAPVAPGQRTWGFRDMACLWVSMAACIPTYMLASSNIDMGMNWWQALLAIVIGNVIVLLPMIVNAHAGTKYGIPFPVYCRAAFGMRGANIPALIRAFVACGWFGIQTWIGGDAMFQILAVFEPAIAQRPKLPGLGISDLQFTCFMLFWALNVLVIVRGIDTIRWLLNIKAPILILLGLALLAWAINEANGFGPVLRQPSKFQTPGQFWLIFGIGVTASVSFWATLSLNIPDFSRFARSQRDQVLGQALGLPTTMALYSFIGVAVTSATVVIYGHEIRDPVKLLTKFQSPVLLIVAMLSLGLATLATNIAANVVSPANDFAHLWPRRISFRIGGLITALVGIVIQPWRLYEDTSGYIFTWLIGVSMLLGSVGGVLLADYAILRRLRLNVAGLYHRKGEFWYTGGVNLAAVVAVVCGVAPCVPGFLEQLKIVEAGEVWSLLYSFGWFVSFGIAALVYLPLMARRGAASQS